MPASGNTPSGQLEVVRSLFSALEEGGIDYLHWKSNEHLDAALRGETDLDLLVDPAGRDRFIAILEALSFAPMLPARSRSIEGVESHLGFDQATGALVHLDVQYSLLVGEQLIKNHRLPVEDWLSSDAGRLDGVRVPRPERELLILYVRAMLKTTNRQLLRSALRGGSPVPDRIQREGRWLAERSTADLLSAAAESSGLAVTSDELVEFSQRLGRGELDRDYVTRMRRSLRGRLREYERLPARKVIPKRWLLRLRSRPVARHLGLGIPPRHLTGTAPLLAVIGADGSGKTRLTRDLEDWLSWKLAVRHLYFGQPKTGVVFKLLNKPGSLARHRDPDRYPPAGAYGVVVRLADSAKWLMLATRRRWLSGRATRECDSGVVVIAERYPLEDFYSMAAPMDGPRLQGRPGILSRLEMRQYRAIAKPDLLLVLGTDLDTLRDRKVDLTVEEHIAKVEAVDALTPGPGRALIDAGSPYEEVLLTAKRAIWEAVS